ncbi:hypothetical protein ACE0DR_26860 [Azotobacter sp. CWF10]
MDIQQRLEAEMREALGLVPAKSVPAKPKQRPSYIRVELSVRKRSGGPTFRFEHRSRSLSTLEAQLEAEKIVRSKGWEVWAVLEVRQVSE